MFAFGAADKWKLVALAGKDWELYDMESDRTEMINLATKNPKTVQNLSFEWNAWARRVNAPSPTSP